MIFAINEDCRILSARWVQETRVKGWPTLTAATLRINRPRNHSIKFQKHGIIRNAAQYGRDPLCNASTGIVAASQEPRHSGDGMNPRGLVLIPSDCAMCRQHELHNQCFTDLNSMN